MFTALSNAIKDTGIFNYMDFYEYVVSTYEDVNYIDIMRCYSAHFQRLCDGNYQKWQQGRLQGLYAPENDFSAQNIAPSQAYAPEMPLKMPPENKPVCCPECGSIRIVKRGKTQAQSQLWWCKDCGKKFI